MILRLWNKPSKPSELQWSSSPGAFERHLQRRFRNLLFAADRRAVSAEELASARAKDAEALMAVRRHVAEIHETFNEDSPAWRPWYLHMDETRNQIDSALNELKQVGGDTDGTLEKALLALKTLVIDTWRAQLRDNPNGLEALNTAARLEAERDRTMTGFVRQLTSPAAPIPKNEVVPALLCEDASTVALFLESLGENERSVIRNWAKEVASAASAEGLDPRSIKPQLDAVGFSQGG